MLILLDYLVPLLHYSCESITRHKVRSQLQANLVICQSLFNVYGTGPAAAVPIMAAADRDHTPAKSAPGKHSPDLCRPEPVLAHYKRQGTCMECTLAGCIRPGTTRPHPSAGILVAGKPAARMAPHTPAGPLAVCRVCIRLQVRDKDRRSRDGCMAPHGGCGIVCRGQDRLLNRGGRCVRFGSCCGTARRGVGIHVVELAGTGLWV
jgi:hypothetical protein